MTSVLYRPMIVSASALSRIPDRADRRRDAPAASSAPYRIDRYSLPASLLNRIRFNSDYAEVGVKPRNHGLACAGPGS